MPDDPSELVLVARRQPAKAVSLLQNLQAAGIQVEVIGEGGTDRVGPYRGSYGAKAAVEVYVHPEDLEQAEAIIQAELAPLASDLPVGALEPGICPGCRHRLPDHATECSECGLCCPG